MGFLPVKSDSGAVPPFEYLPAAAGDYRAGQLLNVAGGVLTAVTADQVDAPPYLCMAQRKAEEGELLPVIRVSGSSIYETALESAAADAAVGGRLQVAAGGLAAKAGAGTFEIVALEGTEEGDIVRGRWALPAGTPGTGGD